MESGTLNQVIEEYTASHDPGRVQLDVLAGPQLKIQIIHHAGYDALRLAMSQLLTDGEGFKHYLYLLAAAYSGEDLTTLPMSAVFGRFWPIYDRSGTQRRRYCVIRQKPFRAYGGCSSSPGKRRFRELTVGACGKGTGSTRDDERGVVVGFMRWHCVR